MRRIAAAIAFVVVAVSAFAGMILPARISGQPLQYMKDGRIHGCGIRLVGIVEPTDPSRIEGFDVSLNLYDSGIALIKGGGFLTTAAGMTSGHKNLGGRKPDSLWLKAPGSKATEPISGEVLPAEDPLEAVMYGTSDFDAVRALWEAIMGATPLQVGIRFPQEPVDRIYQGVASLNNTELAQIRDCFSELLAAPPQREKAD